MQPCWPNDRKVPQHVEHVGCHHFGFRVYSKPSTLIPRLQELAALWCAADEAPGLSRSMREAAAAIESIFVAAPGRVNVVINPAPAIDPRDSAENWEELGAAALDEEDRVRVRARRPSRGPHLRPPICRPRLEFNVAI